MQLLASGSTSKNTCETAFNQYSWTPPAAGFVDSTSTWHHLAVTWKAEKGLTKVYKDGLLVKEVLPVNASW